MRRAVLVFVPFLFLLSACSLGIALPLASQDATSVALAVQGTLTAFAARETTAKPTQTTMPSPSKTETPTNTPTPTLTQTPKSTRTSTPTRTPKSTRTPLPSATATNTIIPFSASLESETIPDGTLVIAGQPFDKVWAVRNTGGATWTDAVRLRNLSTIAEDDPKGGISVDLTDVREIPMVVTKPGQGVEITVPMVAPSIPGRYKNTWQLCVGNSCFGPKLRVVIVCVAPTQVASPEAIQSTGPSPECLEIEAYLTYIESYYSERKNYFLEKRDVRAITELNNWYQRQRQYALSLRDAYCSR